MSNSKQGALPFAKPAPVREASTARRRDFSAQNRESAEIILADIARHGGEGSLSVEWARSVVAKAPAEATAC